MAPYSKVMTSNMIKSDKNLRSRGDYLIVIFLILYGIIAILPLILVLSTSFTDEQYIIEHGYQLFPAKPSVDAYRMILFNKQAVFTSYFVTILITFVGTTLAVTITGCAGYTLSNTDVRYRNVLALFFYIPTLITGGVVPWYFVNVSLGLKDNIFALIIPNLLFSVFNMYLVRNFMKGLPASLRESAKLDGANDITIAFRIYFPLAKSVLATITLFYALGYWNDWYNAVMLVDSRSLYPLQYMLFLIQSQIDAAKELEKIGIFSKLPGESYKMATVIITIGPIVLLYPFLQKYFVSGLTVGAIKG